MFSWETYHAKLEIKLLALRDIFRKNVTNHMARKKLAIPKWINRPVYPCRISEQPLGSRRADGPRNAGQKNAKRIRFKIISDKIEVWFAFQDPLTSQGSTMKRKL